MTFPHWSRVTPYASSCEFAECCVFAKQSPGPGHCGPGPLGGQAPPRSRAPLLPKLRGRFAEFLNVVSLARLRLLASTTCVGFGTVPTELKLRRFSWRRGVGCRRIRRSSRMGPRPGAGRIYLPGGLRLCRRHSIGAIAYPSASLHRIRREHRNVDLSSIGCAFRPRLRDRLTPGGRTWPGKPWTCGGAESHCPFRYSYLHSHSHALRIRFRDTFDGHATLSYHPLGDPRFRFRASVPIIFGAGPLGQ